MNFEDGFPPYPDFFRIFNSHEHSQRLLLPEGYKKYYPNPLPQTALLKKPEGSFWNVKWTISQDETISFQEGWEKFVKDNGVIDRDFLLFTYDGSRSFWVRIHRNGNPLHPINIQIQEISDAEDERTGDDDNNMEEEDSHENMINSLSLGSSDEVNDDDTAICENSEKGREVRRKRVDSIIAEDYLDDSNNPYFKTAAMFGDGKLIISREVIKDNDLKFGSTINLVDGFGTLKRKVVKRKNDRVVVNNWGEMYERNQGKLGDIMIFEIIGKEDVVRSIKVHFVRK